ncbi:MAG: hypothetical protein HUU34_17205 [Saprospiraceae bacterium]|nr:hypothetical protein [Saprospiraceae bacterium]
MKNITFMLVIFLLITASCEKEVIVAPDDFSVAITIAPDAASPFVTCSMPDGTILQFPSKGFTSGTASFMGGLDADKSTMTILSCVFNMDYSALQMEIKTVMADKDGDQVFFDGTAYTFFTNVSTAYYTVTGGTGKYRDAYGWMRTEGTVAQPTMIITATGEGTIVLPNK